MVELVRFVSGCTIRNKEFFFFFFFNVRTVLFFTIRKSRNGIMATEYHCTDCTFTETFLSRDALIHACTKVCLASTAG